MKRNKIIFFFFSLFLSLFFLLFFFFNLKITLDVFFCVTDPFTRKNLSDFSQIQDRIRLNRALNYALRTNAQCNGEEPELFHQMAVGFKYCR